MAATIDDVKDKSFDYIICGGGTAGLTLGARLTEDPNTTVLVLEAGAANIGDMNILRPASYGSHFGKVEYSWNHETIKQVSTGNVTHSWQRGKGLGGSSAINFLCWIKPSAKEIDGNTIAEPLHGHILTRFIDFERLGNPGWNWNNYEKYIRRTERFTPPSEEVQRALNMNFDNWSLGTDGPLEIAYPSSIDEGELKVQQTLRNAGIPQAPRPMNGETAGTYFAPCTYDLKTHTRSYAATAFYLPNKDRPNFTVLVSAQVNRVIPSSDDDGESDFTAELVEFEYEGQVYTVHAKKEVILCAGALKTPQLLELSGIGNSTVLRKVGLPTKVDLPGVGRNVQEHVLVAVSFELKDDVKFETLDVLADPETLEKHLDLHSKGSGLFTTGIIGFSFATLSQISPKADEIIKAAEDKVMKNANNYPPGLLEQHKLLLDRLRNSAGCEFISFPGMCSRPNPPKQGKRYISFYVALNHPFTRGCIHAASKDPAVEPEMDPRYFAEEVDLLVWVEMVKFARSLRNISPLKEMTTEELNPGPGVRTDEEIAAWIKSVMTTTWHTAGSCSMLPQALGGVVDPELKVYGTDNLRVVDLSVVPLHFAAHTQSTAYAIAEQAADIIRGNFQPGEISAQL
ncbi:GMC oxidoreductase [Trametes cinnabarina]|uniref:GMC oxidoreductase n=1 Tax=Pycnoporus cinnabarinus TaxID=5643 RepID=A0A060SQ23_PYCCI|nr:GMC oxidoreductase [Trametes cinnabarina]